MKLVFIILGGVLTLLAASSIFLFVRNNRLKQTVVKPLALPKPTVVSSAKISNLILSPDKTSLVYLGNSGKTIYRRAKDKEVSLTADRLSSINKIIYSPSLETALFLKKDGLYFFDFKRYDLVSQEEKLVSKNVSGAVFSLDGQGFYYAFEDDKTGQMSLIWEKPKEKKKEIVLDLRPISLEKPLLALSPDGQKIALIGKSNTLEKNDLYLFEVETKATVRITTGGNNTEARFTPEGKILFVNKGELFLIDADGQNIAGLGLKTSLDKTAFGPDGLLFIALPQKGGDKIIKLNLSSKAVFELGLEKEAGFSAKGLVVSPPNDYLYFLNAQNQLTHLKIVIP
ncbi:hypothetical protein HY373_00340 [Candidatus Berkelbacteria bacterium]|nr:hypothetical protein [Candidatus Berkelbacteria bacterium]